MFGFNYVRRRFFSSVSVGERSDLSANSVKQWIINWAQGSSGTSSADKLSAYFAAKKVIAEDVSKIPGGVVEVDGDTRNPLPQHPVKRLLWKQPNPTMLPAAFKETLIHWAIDHGGGVAEIELNGRGEPANLWLIHPSRVNINQDDPMRIVYEVTNNDNSVTQLEQDEVFHLSGYSKDGITGYSMLGLMNEVLGFGLQIQRFGTAFLENNGIPPMIISPKDGTINKENLTEMRDSWKKEYSGSKNAGKTAWIQRAMQIDKFDINQETQQLLENKKFTVADIARFLRVDPNQIQDFENGLTDQEDASASHVNNIMSWFVRFEQEAERKLFTPAEREAGNLEVKFNIAALLRSNLAAQSAFFREMFMIGVYTPNDILRLLDQNPYPEGGNHFIQGAMIPTTVYQKWIDGEIDNLQGTTGTNQNNIAASDNNGRMKSDLSGNVIDALLEPKKDE